MTAEEPKQIVEHLFRHESGKLLAALTRLLGIHNLQLAEEVVQETLLRALEVFKFGRIPENPAAWLNRAARNRALDLIRREKTRRKFAPEFGQLLDTEWTLASTVDSVFLESEIPDEMLRMMFACCHPQIAPESQIMLILKTLCGFGIGEIAHAFLSTPTAVEKRLVRARIVLEEGAREFSEMAGKLLLEKRLDAVHRALYLLFSEGYHSSSAPIAVRADLCFEAIRLAKLIADHPAVASPKSDALLALMCFHAARLAARVDDTGALILLEEQDRSRWDRALIGRGLDVFSRCYSSEETSAYHLEAAIACAHCMSKSFAETDWKTIVALYDRLYEMEQTPIVALNRAIALSQAEGAEAGLRALAAIEDAPRLENYHFYAAAMGELSVRAGRIDEAKKWLTRTRELARSDAERTFADRKLEKLLNTSTRSGL